MPFQKEKSPWNKGLTKETDARILLSSINVSNACKGRTSWNKGLTKETDIRVQKLAITVGNILKGRKRKPMTDEQKKKLSEKMKIAHKEGRAWNIGMSRWNNEPSYPEKFFMKVIANEFEDKEYKYEHPFGKYSIDFAWLHQKKAVEIDGSEHQRFADCIKRDQVKTLCLINDGWQVLRVTWKAMYNDTKNVIAIIKNFVHNQHDDNFLNIRGPDDKIVVDDEVLLQEYKEEVMKFVQRKQKCEKQKIYCTSCGKQRFHIHKHELQNLCGICKYKSEQLQKFQKKENKIEKRKQDILQIDLMKFGWVQKLSNLWRVKPPSVKRWILRYHPEIQFFQRNKEAQLDKRASAVLKTAGT